MQYRYIVVELRDGGSWHLYGDKDRSREQPYPKESLDVLPDLLAKGWTPVREIPVGAANLGIMRTDIQAYCLVLLSKDEDAD